MPEICYKVRDYFLEFLGTSSTSNDEDRRARIVLFSEEMEGAAADITFTQSQKLWMKQDRLENPSLPTPTLIGYMAGDQLLPVLDMLRHEKPVYVLWLEDENRVSLRTHLEPVGEAEG